jgi:hypothetical protein
MEGTSLPAEPPWQQWSPHAKQYGLKPSCFSSANWWHFRQHTVKGFQSKTLFFKPCGCCLTYIGQPAFLGVKCMLVVTWNGYFVREALDELRVGNTPKYVCAQVSHEPQSVYKYRMKPHCMLCLFKTMACPCTELLQNWASCRPGWLLVMRTVVKPAVSPL